MLEIKPPKLPILSNLPHTNPQKNYCLTTKLKVSRSMNAVSELLKYAKSPSMMPHLYCCYASIINCNAEFGGKEVKKQNVKNPFLYFWQIR